MDHKFTWDETKRQTNLRERGLDFVTVIPLFDDERSLVVEDNRKDYGERRFNLYGYGPDEKLYKVTFTRRDERIRIISAFRANQCERKRYEQTKSRP